MPKADGTLTETEYLATVDRLRELWDANGGHKPCPSCGNRSFYYHPSLLGNPSDTVRPDRAHTRVPTFLVYCQKCGYAESYVASRLGIKTLDVSDPFRDEEK